MKFFRKAGRRNSPGIFLWLHPFLLVSLFFLFFLAVPGTGEALVQTVGSRNFYTLNSLLGLTYERSWGVRGASFDRFAYGLSMNFNGFVIDPRIIGLTVNGSFAQEFNSTESSTVEGFTVIAVFLQEKPRRGPLKAFPQPIELRYEFDHYDNATRQNYGISMRYRFEAKQPPPAEDFADANKSRNQNRNQNDNTEDENLNSENNTQNAGDNNKKIKQKQGFSLPLPTLYFDYDRYEFKTDNTDTIHDRLSLRAEARKLHSEYFAEYRLDNYNTDVSKTQLLQLQTNLHYYWKETLTRLEIYNTLFLEDTAGEKFISFTDRTSWLRNLGPAGRDLLFFNGGVNYFSRDSTATYGLDLNAGYKRFFSERFMNFSSAGLGFQKNGDVTDHSESIGNSARYRLSDNILLTNDLSVGQSQDGPLYGLTLGLQIGRSLVVAPSYSYQYTGSSWGGNTTMNSWQLDLSSPLMRNMNFFSQNYYRVLEEKGGLSPHKEKTLSLTSSVLWNISRYNISANASYLRGSTEGLSVGGVDFPNKTTTGITTVSANLYTYLARRMNLNVSAYYQRDNDGFARTVISPLLTWQWRRITLAARYTLNKSDTTTEHRIYLRVTRQFQSILRPFL